MTTDKKLALAKLVKNHPVKLAHRLGYDRLREGLHDSWIRNMAFGSGDYTLQAHRGSYKTTSVEIALWLLMITQPQLTIGFFRKASDDVAEIMSSVERMLKSDTTAMMTDVIYGKSVRITSSSSTTLSTDLCCSVSGSSQLSGYGIGGSVTGKHYDRVFTDDIVTVRDRASRAERERTKRTYQELQNVKNRGGRIINTGTPWHKDDAFILMPEPEKWAWNQTGLISKKEDDALKKSMTRSLHAANYELRHVSAEGAIFDGEPVVVDDAELLYNGIMHIDAAYGGSDGTAVTCIMWHDNKPYVYGELFRETHVDNCFGHIIELHKQLRLGTIYTERNADKGYLAKQFRGAGLPVQTYQETENKFIKISTFARGAWSDIHRLDGDSKQSSDYWDEVIDFTEGSEHDDAPDSLACAIRLKTNKPQIQLFAGGI